MYHNSHVAVMELMMTSSLTPAPYLVSRLLEPLEVFVVGVAQVVGS